MNATRPPRPARARLILLALLALFVAPIVLAWLVSSHRLDWLPSATVNHGDLLVPPVPIDSGGWATRDGSPIDLTLPYGQWRLVLVEPGPCGRECLERIAALGRLRLSLGRELARVHGTLVLYGNLAADVEKAAGEAEFAIIRPTAAGRPQLPSTRNGQPYETFLVDYRGYLVLGYPAGADAQGIRKDLRRLLKGSDTE
jgi:hypothetical protein